MAESPDARLFAELRLWSQQTRGARVLRVKIWHDDGGTAELTIPPGPPAPDAGAPIASPGEWPPAAGWGLRPGEYAYDGRAFKLRGKLWHLLRLLAAAPGRPVEVQAIADEVWGGSAETEDKNIRNHVSMLRAKLARDLSLSEDPIESADGSYRLTLY